MIEQPERNEHGVKRGRDQIGDRVQTIPLPVHGDALETLQQLHEPTSRKTQEVDRIAVHMKHEGNSDDQLASRRKHPVRLINKYDRIPEMLEHFRSEHTIEFPIAKRESMRIGYHVNAARQGNVHGKIPLGIAEEVPVRIVARSNH